MSKKPKDPNGPKKPQSSYFIYSNERRPILQTENKNKKITEISKIISAEWKVMAPTDKEEYDRKSKQMKEEYNLKMGEYKKTDNYREWEKKVQIWEQNRKEKGYKTRGGKKSREPKKPKQPQKMPKRPQSSYFVFSNSRRNQLKEQYPDKKITELSKLISVEWNAFTDDDKKKYEEQARENKERYNKEIAIYKETDEYSEYQERLAEFKKAKKQWDKSGGMSVDSDDDIPKVSLPRKPKDIKAPKKPLTSYFLYAKEVRESTKLEHPNKQITEIAKEISKKWKVLTDDEKIPYSEEALRLKEIYKKEAAVYKDSPSAKEFESKLAAWKEECARRKRAAREKMEKKAKAAAAAAAKAKKSPKKRKTLKNRKQRMEESSSEEDSDSDSDSSSDGSSSSDDSDSDSSSSSGSDSGSDSDSDSE